MFQLKAKDGKALPEWLLFNKTDASLRGVPLYPDTQESKLILYAYRNSEDFATDELKLTVKTYSDDSLPKLLNCTKRNFTILSILFNESIKNIKPKQRLILLENLAHFWGIDSVSIFISILNYQVFVKLDLRLSEGVVYFHKKLFFSECLENRRSI